MATTYCCGHVNTHNLLSMRSREVRCESLGVAHELDEEFYEDDGEEAVGLDGLEVVLTNKQERQG